MKNIHTMTKYFFLLVTLFSLQTSQAQWLTVNGADAAPYNIPTQLIHDYLTGPGIEIMDVQYTGSPSAVGYFTGGTQSIDLNRGLILSTGTVASGSNGVLIGADNTGSDFASTDHQSILDDSLLAPLTSGPLRDLARYQITFRASNDSIRFRYVFASEEYPEYACSAFNDVFGFFLEGPGYPSPVNIARIPGTNLPVNINNVHPANGSGCPAQSVHLYNNNNNSSVQPVYDGFLDVFVAEAAVQPCGIYTMTLAIADVSDGVFDSAVFLEAKSFGSTEAVTPSFEPGTAIIPENAIADTVSLTFANLPATLLPLTVSLGGTAVNGLDYQFIDSAYTITSTDTVLHLLVQPIPDSMAEPFETVDLIVHGLGCFTRSFTLYISDPEQHFQTTDTLIMLSGQTLELTAPAPTSLSDKTWTVTNPTPLPIAPVNTIVYSSIDIVNSANGEPNSVPIAFLNDLSFLQSVCVNVEHPWAGDVNLYLFAPNGKFLELSTDNGDGGDNYTNTCFSPASTQSITLGLPVAPASAAPFTGTFQPEGDWKDLLGTPVDGAWKMGVQDDANGYTGQLLNWSMTFSGARLGDFHYLWNTGDTTKNLSVTTPGIYEVSVSNSVSTIKKSFIVTSDCSTFTALIASTCAGQPYVFDGELLSNAGVYTALLPQANGCDSVVTLTLNVLPVSADSLVVALQPGETYSYNGVIFTEAGRQSFTLPNSVGCDSVFTVIVTFTSATKEPEAFATLHFSPNPSVGETVVSWDNSLSFSQMRVFDTTGRLVFSQKITSQSGVNLKTADWATGWYSLQLEGFQGQRARGQLLVGQ